MSKHARINRRLGATAKSADRHAPEPSEGFSLKLIGALAAVVVVGLMVAAVAFVAATSTAGASGLPSGTQVFPESNHEHVTGAVTYDHVPPVGGAHNATPLNCGIYGTAVPNEYAVHSLEHGAVWITYQPTLAPDQLAQLQNLVTTHYVGTERYLILSPYPGIPSPIVVSAWGYQLQLGQVSDQRLLDFIAKFAGGGQGGEQGGPCTGGVGNPDA